jgi:hypothetical protein
MAIVAVSLIAWSQLDEIMDVRMVSSDLGPVLLPAVYTYALGACGLILVGIGLWRHAQVFLRGGDRRERSRKHRQWSWDRLKDVLAPIALPMLMAGTVAVFIKVLPIWGFLYTSFTFLGFWLLLFAWWHNGRRIRIRMANAVLGAAAIAGLFYGVFRFLIKVPLP